MGLVVYMWDFIVVYKSVLLAVISLFRSSDIFPFDKNPTFDFDI